MELNLKGLRALDLQCYEFTEKVKLIRHKNLAVRNRASLLRNLEL
jgi:hypothetical protein